VTRKSCFLEALQLPLSDPIIDVRGVAVAVTKCAQSVSHHSHAAHRVTSCGVRTLLCRYPVYSMEIGQDGLIQFVFPVIKFFDSKVCPPECNDQLAAHDSDKVLKFITDSSSRRPT
jgi:hypothetical protein